MISGFPTIKQLVFCGLGYVHGVFVGVFFDGVAVTLVFWKLRSWVDLIANPFINGWLSNGVHHKDLVKWENQPQRLTGIVPW